MRVWLLVMLWKSDGFDLSTFGFLQEVRCGYRIGQKCWPFSRLRCCWMIIPFVSEWPFVAKEVFNGIIAGKSHEAEDKKDTKDKHDTYGHDHYGREIFVVHVDRIFTWVHDKDWSWNLCASCHRSSVTKVNSCRINKKGPENAENNGESRKQQHNMFKAHLRVGERQAIDPSLSVHVRLTKGQTYNEERTASHGFLCVVCLSNGHLAFHNSWLLWMCPNK